jgi:hypothetical protein
MMDGPHTTATEYALMVALCEAHLKSIMAMDEAVFDRLLVHGTRPPLELAELFEDAANIYLAASEAISRQWQESRPGVHASPPQTEYREQVTV